MQPEISHRCPSCGASVRDGDALFCPECGKPLSAKPAASDSEESADEINSSNPEDSPEEDAPELVAPLDSSSDSETIEASAAPEPANEAESPAAPAETQANVETKDNAATQTVHRRGDKTRERLHRASEVARGVTRGVIEEPVKRVEKIRQASTVVIEEASYDPSLRFVLVALGLFIVFVILLVVSKVMG